MIIICDHFNTLCFVGKKKRIVKEYAVCLHAVNLSVSSAIETIENAMRDTSNSIPGAPEDSFIRKGTKGLMV